jgi:hypothetical protein
MPFDLLPHHNIKMPEVQFYHPPWQLAQMALEARQKGYDAMLKGLDSVLSAVDPLNMAKRRMAMMQADYEMKMYPMQLEFMRKNGFAMPKNAAEMMAYLKLQQMQDEGHHFDNYSGNGYGSGGSGGGDGKAGPYADNAKAGRNINANFSEDVPGSAESIGKAAAVTGEPDYEQINTPIHGVSQPTSEGGASPDDEQEVVAQNEDQNEEPIVATGPSTTPDWVND